MRELIASICYWFGFLYRPHEGSSRDACFGLLLGPSGQHMASFAPKRILPQKPLRFAKIYSCMSALTACKLETRLTA
jgi:hypothetical protein